MGQMRILAIAQCGYRKIWDEDPSVGPTPAKYAYTGVFAKKTQDYAKKFYPNDWCILSAKYGFLKPNDLIEDYNVTFNDPSTNPISIDQLIETAKNKNLMEYDEFVVVAGKAYVDKVKEVFRGKTFIEPLNGIVGNGKMMQKMAEAIRTGIQLRK
jgi:cytoplasmic iron level regulating protein YaaA (DUF328/UPF0246 family)